MNTIQILNIIASIIYLSLIIILTLKTPKFVPAKLYSVFMFFFLLWSFFSLFFFKDQLSEKSANLIINLTSIGWIFLSSIFLIFILIFTKRDKIIKNKLILSLIIGIPFFFLIAQWNHQMVVSKYLAFGWRGIWTQSLYSYLFFVYSFSFNFLSIFLGFKMISKSDNLIRIKQMKIIVYGGLFAFSILYSTELILPFIFNIFNFYNIGSLSGVPWGIFSVYGIVRYRSLDITPKFAAENIINTMFDNLILLNTDKKIISVNKATIRTFGYSNEELIGKPLSIILKNSNEYDLILKKIDTVDEYSNIETVFKTKEGVNVVVVLSISMIISKIGLTEGIVCIVNDITELKKNEQIKDVLLNISEASKSTKNLRELSEMVYKQINLLMYAKNFYIALIHDKELATYTFPYVVDINPEEHVDPSIPLELKKSLTHYVFRTKKPLLVNDSFIENKLSKLGVELVGVNSKSWIGVPLKVTNEEIIGVIVLQSYSDYYKYSEDDLNVLSITSNTIASAIRYWETKEVLNRMEKMEIVGKLAGGVAHDLNNVLGAIVSYPDLILKKLSGNSSIRKQVITMQQSGIKAAAIVQDLLTLARRGVTINSIENLNDIIVDYIKSPIFEKLQKFHSKVDIKTDLLNNIPMIKGSSIQLLKTIMNLVSNAAESIISEGSILITTEKKTLKEEKKGFYRTIKSGNYVLLKVKDTGIGISKNDLNKIFEPFYTKKKMGRSGTGLGMAVVWGILEDHNGFIDVESLEGKGTTFELYFPETKELKAENLNNISINEFYGSGEKILIIDDVKIQREISTALLTELGYSVNSVSNGKSGIEYLKNNEVDLCILDMIMEPGIDGLDTFIGLKKIDPNIKVIIASGYSESSRVKDALNLGAKFYVQKPYTQKKIGIVIKKVLSLK